MPFSHAPAISTLSDAFKVNGHVLALCVKKIIILVRNVYLEKFVPIVS